MNLSLMDIEGELLIVPNFTLYGDARKGRRPGYSGGAAPEIATELFDKLCAKAQTLGIKKVATGVFQADMKVALVNDGPVTLLLDSEKLF
jgi:D-tyrosyl-tRNA(Tyr) deacylase